MNNIAGRKCKENQNTRFMFNSSFLFSKIIPLYRIMGENVIRTKGHI